MNTKITQAVDDAVDDICRLFKKSPTLFFTENDLVCFFNVMLSRRLEGMAVHDIDGKKHSLVHMEYPTPFRCDMSGGNFSIKQDKDKTQNNRFYKRGHYDIAILNPDFISNNHYNIIKAQHFSSYQSKVLNKSINSPVILYALEFMYSRDPINSDAGADRFLKVVLQDYDKLLACRCRSGICSSLKGFISHVKMLVFVKGSSQHIESRLISGLSQYTDIVLCFGK